ncbi:MAG: fatty acid desaturase [Planctomycetota bacterium]|nr:fatty acid desaturase [Planctomycetota bacterium]
MIAIGLLHAGCLLAPFFFSWTAVIAAAVLWFVGGCLGITLGYHRFLTHRSFQTYKPVEYFLAICGTLNWQGGPIHWVGTHRIHHHLSDEPGDPHSPVVDGFTWAHMFWCMTKDDPSNDPRDAAKDLQRDPIMVAIDKYFYVFMVPLAVGLYFLGGWACVIWGVCVRTTLMYHCTWLVNSASHVWGYRNFTTSDASRNNWWVALLSWGEGWHNNHHAQQRSAAHGMRWWEVDITFAVIRTMEILHLCKRVVRPDVSQMTHRQRAAAAVAAVASVANANASSVTRAIIDPAARPTA